MSQPTTPHAGPPPTPQWSGGGAPMGAAPPAAPMYPLTPVKAPGASAGFVITGAMVMLAGAIIALLGAVLVADSIYDGPERSSAIIGLAGVITFLGGFAVLAIGLYRAAANVDATAKLVYQRAVMSNWGDRP